MNHMAHLRGDDVQVVVGRRVKFPHGGVVLVVDRDCLLHGLFADHVSGDGIEYGEHCLKFADQVVHAGRGGAVLGIHNGDHGDVLHAEAPVLGHTPQRVAHCGDDYCGDPLIGAFQPQLHIGLHNRTGKGGQIALGQLQLGSSSPHAHGDQTGGMYQLLRGVWGKAAHHLLPLLQVAIQLLPGIGAGPLQPLQTCLPISHCVSPPCSAS